MATDAIDFHSIFSRLMTVVEKRAKEIVFEDDRIDSDLLRAEALRYFTRVFSAGLVSQVEGHDPSYPNFIKILSPWINWGYPNPEGTYSFAPVHGDYAYRIHGTRGQARLFDVEIWDGDIAELHKARSIGGMRDIFDGKSDININEDGTFEIILSREKQEGNWIELPEGYGHLYIRQWYYDYENECPGEFHIERIGAKYPRPTVTAEQHAANFERLIVFVDTVFYALGKGIELHYRDDANIVPFPDGLINSEQEGEIAFRNQHYGRGRFYCGPDEAVILEVEPPKAEFWMFGLLSPFWESYDWMGRQISINGHYAEIDDDGLFRAVICHKDPGIVNWLDAGGHEHGLIAARYNWTDSVPIPSLRKVPFEQLNNELPKTTKRITPEERSEVLRRRLLSQRSRMVDW